MKKILWIALILCSLVTACAVPGSRRMNGILPSVKNLEAASQMFGPPVETTGLGVGRNRSLWHFTRYEQIPGQYVEKKENIGHDRDGFPVFRIVRYWVPFHHEERSCSLEIVSGPSGFVESSSWQGNACDELLTPEGRQKAYAPSPMPDIYVPSRIRREKPGPFFGDDII